MCGERACIDYISNIVKKPAESQSVGFFVEKVEIPLPFSTSRARLLCSQNKGNTHRVTDACHPGLIPVEGELDRVGSVGKAV